MANLLSLPLELRSQIYLDTLNPHLSEPLTDLQILNDDPIPSYWKLSFPPALLFVNKQINAEAKHVFYGKNTWVMTATVQRACNTLPPAAAFPYVQTALLKIHFHAGRSFQASMIRNSIDEGCRMLSRMHTLRALRIECAENRSWPAYPIRKAPNYPLHSYSAISSYLEWKPEMSGPMNDCLWGYLTSDQTLVSDLLQPLLALPGNCSLQKGDICVESRDMVLASILGKAFSNCLDAVIALRHSPREAMKSFNKLPM